MTRPLWTLEVVTFRGTAAFGAQHSYGVLQAPDGTVDHDGQKAKVEGQKWSIYRIMTAEQAERLNEANQRFGRSYGLNHAAGDASHQFDSDEEVERYGAAVFAHLCDDSEAVLVVTTGFGADLNPSKPLVGPAEIVEALAEIHALDASETSHDWTPVRQEATDRWEEALTRFDLLAPHDGVYLSGSDAPADPTNRIARVTTEPDGTLTVEVR